MSEVKAKCNAHCFK